MRNLLIISLLLLRVCLQAEPPILISSELLKILLLGTDLVESGLNEVRSSQEESKTAIEDFKIQSKKQLILQNLDITKLQSELTGLRRELKSSGKELLNSKNQLKTTKKMNDFIIGSLIVVVTAETAYLIIKETVK